MTYMYTSYRMIHFIKCTGANKGIWGDICTLKFVLIPLKTNKKIIVTLSYIKRIMKNIYFNRCVKFGKNFIFHINCLRKCKSNHLPLF